MSDSKPNPNEAAIVADIMEKAKPSFGDPEAGDVEKMKQLRDMPEEMRDTVWTLNQEARLRDCQSLFIESLTRYFGARNLLAPDDPTRRSNQSIALLAVETLKMNGYTHKEVMDALTDTNFRIEKKPGQQVIR